MAQDGPPEKIFRDIAALYSAPESYSHVAPLAPAPGCLVCAGAAPPTMLHGVDRICVITLKSAHSRTRDIVATLHRMGLCRQAALYVTEPQRNAPRHVWASHAAVARLSLRAGERRILVLEDDAEFSVDGPTLARRVSKAMARLPQSWWGLFLGHWPLQMYPAARGLMRARSACAHAYIANQPLLEWLAGTEPHNPRHRVCPLIGGGIDAAFANLPGMYALFPMVAFQREAEIVRHDLRLPPGQTRRGLLDPLRYRHLLVNRSLRFAEAAALLLSPAHAATLERFGARSGRRIAEDAELILASGLFDDSDYMTRYPDVAEAHALPLFHVLRLWRKHPTNPHPLFDTLYYLERYPEVRRSGLHPFVHYLREGGAAGLDPNPHFDAKGYIQAHPESIIATTPLQHFVQRQTR